MLCDLLITSNPIDYNEANSFMLDKVHSIIQGHSPSLIWFLEHPPLYTAGSSANPKDLLDKQKLPVYHTNRGGKYTYHGPGQRIIYFLLNLKELHRDAPDIKRFVKQIQSVVENTLTVSQLKITSCPEHVGIWVNGSQGMQKIGAIGIRVKKWVTYHGVAINICPDLLNFTGIVPCGIKEYGVTSVTRELGQPYSVNSLDTQLMDNITKVFNLKLNIGKVDDI